MNPDDFLPSALKDANVSDALDRKKTGLLLLDFLISDLDGSAFETLTEEQIQQVLSSFDRARRLLERLCRVPSWPVRLFQLELWNQSLERPQAEQEAA